MITNFGRILRKIRIDYDETMRDMAEKLGVTASYLSAVEKGKRNVSDGWIDILAKKYDLKSLGINLETLEMEAYKSRQNIRIGLDSMCSDDKDLFLSIIKHFNKLDETTKTQMREIFCLNN